MPAVRVAAVRLIALLVAATAVSLSACDRQSDGPSQIAGQGNRESESLAASVVMTEEERDEAIKRELAALAVAKQDANRALQISREDENRLRARADTEAAIANRRDQTILQQQAYREAVLGALAVWGLSVERLELLVSRNGAKWRLVYSAGMPCQPSSNISGIRIYGTLRIELPDTNFPAFITSSNATLAQSGSRKHQYAFDVPCSDRELTILDWDKSVDWIDVPAYEQAFGNAQGAFEQTIRIPRERYRVTLTVQQIDSAASAPAPYEYNNYPLLTLSNLPAVTITLP
ncbi:MAG: hypothetical protein Cons2KO_11100 [Congregibacter sp.]